MAKVTPQEFAEKWQRRLAAATPDLQRGIERVTVAPGQQAAAQQTAMLQNLTESVTSGRWARKVAAVPLQDWKSATLNKGVARVAPGATAAMPKMQRIAAELLPAVDQAAAAARALPKVTIEDSINRAATFMQSMHAFKSRS